VTLPPETPLRGLPLAVVDCEATDLPGTGRIVEIAVVHLTLAPDCVPVVAYTSKVRPVDADGRQIPSERGALKAHGLTDESLATAPTWAEVFTAVDAACKDRVIVAYNVPADHAFMCASGASPAPWNVWLDLHVVARHLNRYEHSLAQVAERHGFALDAHGATGDAVQTALLARPLLLAWWRLWTGESAQDPTLGDLLTWQHEAVVRQEREFVAYLVKKGARGEAPDSPWHAMLGVDPPPWPEPPKATHRVERDGRVVPVEGTP
jgi:DNA polymerase III epsilon subunit-like protein